MAWKLQPHSLHTGAPAPSSATGRCRGRHIRYHQASSITRVSGGEQALHLNTALAAPPHFKRTRGSVQAGTMAPAAPAGNITHLQQDLDIPTMQTSGSHSLLSNAAHSAAGHTNGTEVAPHAQPVTAVPAGAGAAGGVAGDLSLYAEVQACESWEDVLEVIEDEAEHISLYTASQAMSKLANLLRAQRAGSPVMAALHDAPGFKLLITRLTARVAEMSRAQLCNSLHAMSKLHVSLEASQLAAYDAGAASAALSLNARDISQILNAYATLKHRPTEQALAALAQRTVGLLGEPDTSMQGQSLSMVLHACGQLGYRNPQLLLPAGKHALATMHTLSPQSVANITWALVQLSWWSPALLEAAAQAYLAAPTAYKPIEVCNILWAMTHCRHHPQDVLGVMAKQLTGQARQLRPADFATLFLALGTFTVHPGNQLLSELTAAMLVQLRRFGPRELCSVYWGLTMLGEAKQPLCASLARAIISHHQQTPLEDRLLRQTFQGYLGSKLSAAVQSGMSNGKGSRTVAAPVAFPQPMVAEMRQAWGPGVAAGQQAWQQAAELQQEKYEARVARYQALQAKAAAEGGGAEGQDGSEPVKPPQPNPGIGRAAARGKPSAQQSMREEVIGLLKALKVPHQVGLATKDGLVVIDVALKPNDNRFLALQVVMEHEHSCNTLQLTGPTQFETQLLEVNGWEVKHVRAADLKRLEPKLKPLFLADLLRSVGMRVAGGTAAAASRAPQGLQRTGSNSWGDVKSEEGALDMLVSEGEPQKGRRRLLFSRDRQ